MGHSVLNSVAKKGLDGGSKIEGYHLGAECTYASSGRSSSRIVAMMTARRNIGPYTHELIGVCLIPRRSHLLRPRHLSSNNKYVKIKGNLNGKPIGRRGLRMHCFINRSTAKSTDMKTIASIKGITLNKTPFSVNKLRSSKSKKSMRDNEKKL